MQRLGREKDERWPLNASKFTVNLIYCTIITQSLSSRKNENPVISSSLHADESQVKFGSPQNISGASQQNRVVAFCITHYEPPRPLRSSGTGLLSVPRVRTKHGEAAFSYYEPHIWNKLPENCRSAPTFTF